MFPGERTHNTKDMCFPGGETHNARDMCFPGEETHNIRDMSFLAGGKDITHFPGLYSLKKKKIQKWPILHQNHGLTPLEKSQFFDFLNFLLF